MANLSNLLTLTFILLLSEVELELLLTDFNVCSSTVRMDSSYRLLQSVAMEDKSFSLSVQLVNGSPRSRFGQER